MILEPGKLTFVRARFSIAIVILLAAFACTGGPTGDYPFTDSPGAEDAGLSGAGGSPAGSSADGGTQGASLDAGSSAGELDAASPTTDPCNPLPDAGDAGQADGEVGEASVDAQIAPGDAATDGGDSGADADAANDGQIDTGANFPEAAGDAQPFLSDGSSDAPHMPSTDAACVP